MDVVFVGDRCGDHSPSSGYDQVCSLFPAAGWLSGRRLADGDITWHRRPAHDGSPDRPLFHVFYGDCSGKTLPPLLRRRYPHATIVSTVHQPVERLVADPVARASLGCVDAIITVSDAQARELATLGLSASVHAVPHGVWTWAFRPSRRKRPTLKPTVLLIGRYLRDWDDARRTIRLLADAGVGSTVVGSHVPEDLADIAPLVELRPQVTEPELAQLYDESAALLLPVVDGTASNALLEAMAAGCPVVSTAVPPLVDEYVGDRHDAFPRGRADIAAARVLGYVTEPARRAARSSVLTARAEAFDWSRLGDAYRRVFEDVRASRSAPPVPADHTRRRAAD